ncbi:hypothetical protein BKA70DRAFT_1368605 [Coprinopsis sp. MPI-PUGE-AT-0042]|nr:hypothetical protein BKA70DRAFT_1368605 [Coprinopsis sp. MPI-PUGE-AT-0042]
MATATNLEEAANVAMESVSNLDNLPNEVQHILAEIRHLDKRCQSLQSDIAKDQARYIKHVLRQSLQMDSSAINVKAHLPARIAAAYAEVDKLSDEKVELASRLVGLLARAQARLDSDVTQVRALHGESAEETPFMPVPLNPAAQISESLRSALSGTFASSESISTAGTPPASVPSIHGNKKRRLNGQPFIKLRATTPIPTTTSAGHSGRGRPGRPKAQVEMEVEPELDAELEEEMDEEDLTLYCFCQKRSYGDMIGCDNTDCPYQWFHIGCVGVKPPLPDKWYCPECSKQRSSSDRRKGRKMK